MRRGIVLVLLFAFCLPLRAQDLEDYVAKYTSANGKGYMQPLADAFGAAMNSGLYHNARIPTFGLNLYFGVETMTALIAADQKVFTAKTESPFSPETSAEVPTIFGTTKGYSAPGTGGTAFNFPGGLDLSKAPVAVPQLTVGSLMGTEATLRFINVKLDDNFGKVKLLGLGVRHNLSQYLPMLPLDVAAGLYIQKFEVGDIVEANTKYFGLQASYRAGLLTFYGGAGIESASLDITYQLESSGSTSTVNFELDAANSARFTVGLNLQLAVVDLHADYNFGAQKVLALGLGFGF